MPAALITGANSGIGLALALEFARRGFAVAAGMRDPTKGAALLGEAAREKLPVRAVRLDVTQAASIDAALADIRAREGGVDVLVNNAGVSANGPLELLNEDHHRLAFETNYWGPVRLMQAVAPEMRERRAGRIVNISSMMRQFALPGTIPYAASKAALEMASEIAAMEMGQFGVRVVVIEPGVVVSNLMANTAGAGRWSDPAETPYAAVFANARRIQTAMRASPALARDAARTIADIALAEDPPFRALVGKDANNLVPARQAMADEAWIAMASYAPDAHAKAVTEKLHLEAE